MAVPFWPTGFPSSFYNECSLASNRDFNYTLTMTQYVWSAAC